MTDTTTEDYLSLVDAALEDAEEAIFERLNTPIAEDDFEGQLRLNAMKHDRAAIGLGQQYSDLTQAILHIMFRMEQEQFYRYLRGEYTSLKAWANVAFAKLVEDEIYTWDYISRFCNTVTDVLIPMSKAPVFNTETGEIIADERTILQNASPVQMKEMPFFFANADDNTRAEIATVLSQPATTRKEKRAKAKQVETLKNRVREQMDKKNGVVNSSGTTTTTTTPTFSKVEVLVEHLADGGVRFSGQCSLALWEFILAATQPRVVEVMAAVSDVA